MKVILEPLEAENYFHTALCNGLSALEHYGIAISYEGKDYNKAKESLAKLGKAVCYEDILLQILRNGDRLYTVDFEGGDESVRKSITLKDVHERLHTAPNDYLMEMIFERDDETTADVILQWLFFREIVFG